MKALQNKTDHIVNPQTILLFNILDNFWLTAAFVAKNTKKQPEHKRMKESYNSAYDFNNKDFTV